MAAFDYINDLLGPFINGGEFLTRWRTRTLLKSHCLSVAAGLLL